MFSMFAVRNVAGGSECYSMFKTLPVSMISCEEHDEQEPPPPWPLHLCSEDL